MESKTFTSQKDPPEGARDVIDRELKRSEAGQKPSPQSEANKKAMEDAAPQTEGRPGP